MASDPPAQPTPSSPPGAKRLGLDPEARLAEGLCDAFQGVITYAVGWAARVGEQPEASVHSFRKSIRRARALLRMVQGMIPADVYGELTEALREPMRDTSAARDADVLVALVAAYPRKPKTREALDALQALLEERRAAVHSKGRLIGAMRDGARSVAACPDRLASALPMGVNHKDLRKALKVGHARARKSYLVAGKSREDEDVHDWRKRVKELRYQLELLEPLTGATRAHRACAQLAEDLGEITDLFVLRDCVLAHRERLQDTPVVPLLKKLEKRIAKRQERQLQDSAKLFELKPGAFAKRILSGVSPASTSGRLLMPKD